VARARSIAAPALWTLAVARLVEAAVLRRRTVRLAPLPPPPPGDDALAAPVVVTAAGAAVDAGTRRAVAQLLTGDTALVDLVPERLPSDRALRLLRRLDVERLGTDALYTPGGAHEALALRPDVAAGVRNDRQPAGLSPAGMARGDLVRCTVTAQRRAASRALGRGGELWGGP
jgi:hypothetical protein